METVLQNRIHTFRNATARIDQQLAYEVSSISRLTEKIKRLEEDKTRLVKAVGLIDRCIEVISANGIGKMESIVSAGLQLVFKDKSMGLVVEKKETARGYTYRLLVKQGSTLGNPMNSFGGAVQNVMGFLLRVIMIKRFKLAKMLVLDENFSNVGNIPGYTYLVRTSELLKELCDMHGFDILAITHQPILASAANSVYRVSIKEGIPSLVKVDGQELDEIAGNAFETNQAEVVG